MSSEEGKGVGKGKRRKGGKRRKHIIKCTLDGCHMRDGHEDIYFGHSSLAEEI